MLKSCNSRKSIAILTLNIKCEHQKVDGLWAHMTFTRMALSLVSHWTSPLNYSNDNTLSVGPE